MLSADGTVLTLKDGATVTATMPNDRRRHNRWVTGLSESRKVFQRQNNGTWKEFVEDGGRRFVISWNEVESTPDYVLLQDDKRKMQMRLREHGSEWKFTTGEEKWTPFISEGGWDDDPSDTSKK